MPNNTEFEIALRVLRAIVDHVEPDAAEVAELRRISPERASLSVEELAREVVMEALRRKRASRAR